MAKQTYEVIYPIGTNPKAGHAQGEIIDLDPDHPKTKRLLGVGAIVSVGGAGPLSRPILSSTFDPVYVIGHEITLEMLALAACDAEGLSVEEWNVLPHDELDAYLGSALTRAQEQAQAEKHLSENKDPDIEAQRRLDLVGLNRAALEEVATAAGVQGLGKFNMAALIDEIVKAEAES